jgi:hypothetical protein
VQEFLGADQSTFRKRLGLIQNVLSNGLHDSSTSLSET